MRLVDADEAIQTLEGLTEQVQTEGATLVKALIFAALKSRSITPTVDAVPVKYGKWNLVGTLERYAGMKLETCSEFRCSICDSPQTFFVPIAYYNYCPMCGAKMNGGDVDD